MRFIPKLKIRGKRATAEQIESEISALIHGNGSRPYPISTSEVARILGISRTTVYYYLNRLKEQGKVSKKVTGRFDLPATQESAFQLFNKEHQITGEPLVAEWMEDLTTRKGGQPIANWRTRIRAVESVCNSCQIHPSDLLVSQKSTEKIMRRYANLARQNKIYRDSRGVKSNDITVTMYNKVQAVRDFCSFYDITWRRGVSGIMSQKVPGHGKYADIRFTAEEFDRADKYLKERCGIDSDVYRWFWVGIESCARQNALYHMKNDWSKLKTKSGGTVFLMSAIESKTESIRGGKWTKFITRKDTQTSQQLLRNRHCDHLTVTKEILHHVSFQTDLFLLFLCSSCRKLLWYEYKD